MVLEIFRKFKRFLYFSNVLSNIMMRDIANFDNNNYPIDNMYRETLVSRNVIGYMKDDDRDKKNERICRVKIKLYVTEIIG